MLSLVFLYVFNFALLAFMSCVNYIIEKKKKKERKRLLSIEKILWNVKNCITIIIRNYYIEK